MEIKCPKCHSDNTDTARFCSNCATPLPSRKEIPVTETLETPKEELTTGSTFAGRYQIIEELGKGGMGKVYKVHDTEIREKVALKLLKPEIAADEKTIERFRNEIKVARKISHRNVCRMYDLGDEKGTRYITMEYVEGEDLKSMIRMVGQLSSGKAISIAKQVCEGLAEAHNLGVIHRDLKPSNIMIDKFGNAKIMDFGIARSLRAKGITGTGVMIGTPEYMSPEQVEGKETDQRTDIYSLGVILYEMVTGQVPFEGDTAFSIALKHKSEMPRDPREFNAQIDEDLSRTILKCMEKDKGERYQNVEELYSDLAEIEERIPTTQRVIPERKPLTAREITAKFNLRKLFIPALVLFVLIAVIFLSVILIKRLPTEKQLPPQHKQISFSGNASCPAISPDGKFAAYVDGDTSGEQLVKIHDMVSGQALEVFKGENCDNLQWLPDGSELSFSARVNDSEWGTYIVPRFGGATRRLGMFPYLVWSPDGSQYAWGVVWKKEIWLANKETGESKTLTLSGSFTWLHGLDWSPLGNLILFITADEEERSAIWTTTTDGKKQYKIVEDSVPLFSPRWSPSGDAIFYLRGREQAKELWKIQVSPDTGESSKSASLVLSGLQAGNYFTLTSDGKKFLYTRELQYSNLWLATVEGLGKNQMVKTRQLTTGTLMNNYPSISPDGILVAFSRGDGKTANIYVMPVDGGSPQQITFLNSINYGPVWSPDSKKIAFGSNQGGTPKVWKVNVRGGKPDQFAGSKLSANTFMLDWSPGQNILYHRPGNRNFHILYADTEEEKPLVKDESVGWMFGPKYSPDGIKVAVMWNRRPSRGLWIIPLEDTSQAFFVKENIMPIGWSSDGRWVYVSEEKEGFIKILRIELESRKEKELVSIEFTLEQGEPDYSSICMAPNGKQFVFPVYKTHSDVWIVENFDQDTK